MTSAVLIVPDADRDAANAFGESMGWGPNNYSVALSADGAAPATHWGCRADVRQTFLDLLADPPPEAAPVLAVLISDIADGVDPHAHWMATLAANSLQIVQSEDAGL